MHARHRAIQPRRSSAAPPLDIIQTYGQHGLVPECAMAVSRTADGGEMTTARPTSACGCYFEEMATMVPPTSCTQCTRSSQCPSTAPNCNRFGLQGQPGHTTGYCEP